MWESYKNRLRLRTGIAVTCIVLWAIWRSFVEVQFWIMSDTTTATSTGGRVVFYRDGEEEKRDKLEFGEAPSASFEIDYLPGVGLPRVHGTHYYGPFAILLIGGAVAFVLIWPTIKEAREYTSGKGRRR